MSSPLRVPASRSSMRAKWKRRIFRPASANGSPPTTPGVRPVTRRGSGLVRGAAASSPASAVSPRSASSGKLSSTAGRSSSLWPVPIVESSAVNSRSTAASSRSAPALRSSAASRSTPPTSGLARSSMVEAGSIVVTASRCPSRRRPASMPITPSEVPSAALASETSSTSGAATSSSDLGRRRLDERRRVGRRNVDAGSGQHRQGGLQLRGWRILDHAARLEQLGHAVEQLVVAALHLDLQGAEAPDRPPIVLHVDVVEAQDRPAAGASQLALAPRLTERESLLERGIGRQRGEPRAGRRFRPLARVEVLRRWAAPFDPTAQRRALGASAGLGLDGHVIERLEVQAGARLGRPQSGVPALRLETQVGGIDVAIDDLDRAPGSDHQVAQAIAVEQPLDGLRIAHAVLELDLDRAARHAPSVAPADRASRLKTSNVSRPVGLSSRHSTRCQRSSGPSSQARRSSASMTSRM